MEPNDLISNPENIKAMIAILQNLLDNNEQSSETKVHKKKNPAPKHKNNIGTAKSKKIKANKNKFESMAEFNMHKDDSVIDQKLSKHPPVARMRDFEFIDMICRVCGKKELVAPSLLSDSPARYKCNDCSRRSG